MLKLGVIQNAEQAGATQVREANYHRYHSRQLGLVTGAEKRNRDHWINANNEKDLQFIAKYKFMRHGIG